MKRENLIFSLFREKSQGGERDEEFIDRHKTNKLACQRAATRLLKRETKENF